MRLLTILVLTIILSGCETISNIPTEEWVWQGLNVIDAAQTYNGVATGCYEEDNWQTTKLIGEKPSRREVITVNLIGYSLLNLTVTKLLKKHAPDWLYFGWQAGQITTKAQTVYNNHQIGIRPWGENKPCL